MLNNISSYYVSGTRQAQTVIYLIKYGTKVVFLFNIHLFCEVVSNQTSPSSPEVFTVELNIDLRFFQYRLGCPICNRTIVPNEFTAKFRPVVF